MKNELLFESCEWDCFCLALCARQKLRRVLVRGRELFFGVNINIKNGEIPPNSEPVHEPFSQKQTLTREYGEEKFSNKANTYQIFLAFYDRICCQICQIYYPYLDKECSGPGLLQAIGCSFPHSPSGITTKLSKSGRKDSRFLIKNSKGQPGLILICGGKLQS